MTESFRKTIANIKLTASRKAFLLALLVFGAFMLKGCGEVSERCLFTPAFNLSGDLVPEHTKRSRIIEANSSSWINTGITAMEGGELYAEIEGVVSLCADNDLGYYCTEGKGCFSKNALSTYKYKGGDNYNVAESCVMENDYESKGQVVAIYPDLQDVVSLDQILNPSAVNVEVVPGSWISVALGEATDSAGCSVARFNAYTDGGVEKVNELGSAAFRKKYHVIEGNVANLQRFGGDLSLRVGSEVLLNLDDTYNDANESGGPTTFYGIANSSGILNFYKSPNRSTDDNTLGAQAVYIKKIHCASQNGNGFNGTNLGRVQIAVVDSHALATSGQDINAYMEGKSADFLSNGNTYTPPHSGQVYIRIYDTDYTDNKFNYKVTLSGFSIASYIGSKDDNKLAWAFRFTKDLIKRIVKSSHTGITENTYFREYVAILVTLLIAYLAIRYVMGLERMHLSQLMVSILKIGLVGVLLSPDSLLIFNTYVYDFYFDFLSFLLRAVTGDTSSSDSLTIPIVETSKALFSPGVWARLAAIMVTPPWMIPLGVALVLVFLYTVLIFYIAVLRCLLVILMALITLGLLMIVAPLFLTFLLFQETKQLFQSWTRLAFRYSLEPAFLVAGVNLIGLMCAALLYTVFAFPVCWKCAINVGSEWFPICIYWYVPWGANDKKGQSNLDFYQPSENTTYFFGSKGSPGAEALYYLGFDSMIMIFYAILLLLTFSQVLNSFISAASRIVNALTSTNQITGRGLVITGDAMLGYRSDQNLWDNFFGEKGKGGSGLIGALRGSVNIMRLPDTWGRAGHEVGRARDYIKERFGGGRDGDVPKTGPDEGGAPGAGGGPGGAGGPGGPGTGGAPAGPDPSGKGGSGSPDAAGKGGGGGAGGGPDGPDAPGDDRGGASGRGSGKGLPDGEAKGSFGDDRSDSGPTGWPEVKGGRTGPSDTTDIGDESSKSDATVNLRTSPEFTADDFTRQGGDGYFERQVAHLKRQEQQASSEKEAATFRDHLQQLQEEKAVSPETANLRAELMYREHTTSVLNREIDAVTEQLENLQHQDQANTGDQIAKLVERKEALENNVRENEEEANRIAEFLPEEGKPVAELMPSNEQVAREDRLDEAKHDEGRGITEEDRSLETSSQPADRRNTPDEATKGDEGMVQEDSSTSAEQSIVEEKASEGIEAAAGGKSNEQLESNETGASETAEREDTLDKAAKMREESNQKYLEQFKDTSQNQEDIKKLEEALAEERRALIGTDPTDTTTQNSLEREADLASDSSLEDKSSSVETKPVEANGVVDQAEQNITEKNASGVIGDAASGESNNDGVNASDQSSADKAVIEDAAGDKSQDATSKQLESNEAGASETAEREDRLDKTTSQDEVKGVTEEDGSVSDAVTKAVEESGVVVQADAPKEQTEDKGETESVTSNDQAEQSKHITEKNASGVIGDAASGESNNDGVNASDQSSADKKDPSKEKAGKPSVSEEQAIHEALEKQRAVEEKLEKQEALLEAARNFGDGGEELAGDSSSKAGNISSSSPDFKVSAQHDNTPEVNEAPTAAKPVVADKKEEKGDSSTRGEEIHSSSEPERGSIYTQDEHATEAPKMKEVFEDLCEKTLHQSKQYLDLLHGLDSKLDEISKNHEGNQVLIDSTASQLEDIAKIYFAKFKEVLEKNQISKDIIEKDPQGLFPQWLKSQPFAKHLDLFYSSLDEKTAQDIDKKNSLLAPLRKHMLGGE